MESLISTFHIDWHLIVAQAVNFAVVFFVLYYFALRPLKKMMDERGKTIESGLSNAKKQAELIKAQEAEYEATLAKARGEAAAIMKEVKKDAESRRADLLEKAQADSQAVLLAGKKQLEAEKMKMVDDAKREIVTLVMNATEKVLGEVATGKIETKLVEESIKDIR
jgi:F-type H+-transporting ATPase subunit b